MMAPNPDIRASDADRDRVAASLREHCALGRITMDELQERLESVYAARTLGQLQEVTSDLPEEDLYQLPVPASQPKSTASPARPPSRDLDLTGTRAMWGTWAVVSGINFTIWLVILLATADAVYPWWIWVAGPWGALLLLRTIFGGRPGGY
ncbi:DUF1707 domain-containing protein [Actinomadura madurae]|nr:DUF1707 domain-containing protein [Actinomadura madurae]MCP9953031.1 DUF1707 domain-containing protein [Actinomadura madurae]MCP9969794.1 DUF1707 domain-containing protein [Actinomadura madurae]URM98505.1 DUF1707 domain-containing protein [Actinomadura madurae]URN09190.1 DUF1707 domain-containing protein [Actinomadura madurae]